MFHLEASILSRRVNLWWKQPRKKVVVAVVFSKNLDIWSLYPWMSVNEKTGWGVSLSRRCIPPHMDTCYQSRGTPAKLFPMNINSFDVSFCYWRSHATRNRKKNYSLLFIYYLWQPLIWCLFTRRSEKQMVLWHFQTNARRGEITLMVWWIEGWRKKHVSMLIGFLSNTKTGFMMSAPCKHSAAWCNKESNIIRGLRGRLT